MTVTAPTIRPRTEEGGIPARRLPNDNLLIPKPAHAEAIARKGVGLLCALSLLAAPRHAFARCGDDPGDLPAVAATRTMADAQCCATAQSRGAYILCVRGVVTAALGDGSLPRACRSRVLRCASHSTCGRPGYTACYRTTATGKSKCGIKRDGACAAPPGGAVCTGTGTSCCDACAPPPPAGGPIAYIYDDLGRLTAVIDPGASGNNVAVYRYDGAGNVVSIARSSASTPSVLSFAPGCGPAGTSVTVSGTGFSATSQVRFNGTLATGVTFIDATRLIAPVPSGATQGRITVGSAPSGKDFVPGTCGAPVITDLTTGPGVSCATKPLAAPGGALSLLGTNFDPTPLNDRVVVNQAFARVGPPNATPTATRLDTTVPPDGTSGKVSLSTPAGSAVSPCDVFIPPQGYTTAQVDLARSGRMGDPTVAGATRAVTMPANANIALTLFDGVQNDRACVKITDYDALTGNYVLATYAPGGAPLWTRNNDALIDTFVLPSTGTYTILTQPLNGTTGTLTFTVYRANPLRGPAVIGASTPVQITGPCQNAYLTFPIAAGHRASAIGSPAACPIGWVFNIFDVDGQTVLARTGYTDCITGTFLETDPAQALGGGTYTLLFDPQSDLTGTFNITVYDVEDFRATIQANGTTASGLIGTPGQNAFLSFAGAPGQRLGLKVSAWAAAFFDVVGVYRPDGTRVFGGIWGFGNDHGDAWFEGALDTTGPHTVRLDPDGPHGGAAAFNLYTVPADDTKTTTIGGTAVTVTMSTPGQNAQVTFPFTGTSGQPVTVTVTNHLTGPDSCVDVRVTAPNGGAALASQTACQPNGTFTLTPTLSTQGTYTIVLDPEVDNTGSMDVRVS